MVVERLLRTGARLQVVPEGDKVYYEAFVKELDPVGVTISEPVSSEGKLEMSPGESWRFYLVGGGRPVQFSGPDPGADPGGLPGGAPPGT